MWNLGIIPGARRDLTIFGSIQLATLEWIKKTSLIIDFINFWIWACSSFCHLPNAQIMSTFLWFRVHLSSLGLGGIHPNDILKVQYLPFSTNEDFDVTPTDWELPIFESSPRRPACESGGLSVSTQNQHVHANGKLMFYLASFSPVPCFFQQKHTHIYIYINIYIYIYIYILSLWIQPRWECNWDMTNRGAIGLGFSSPFQTWNSRNRGLGLWADLATPKSISPLANHYVPPFDGKQKHTTWGSIPLSDTHSVAEGFIGWKLGSGSAAVGLRLFVLSSKQTEDV